ncbi:iron ABC transporter permease [Protaetiibacter larvae]|uniref:Iron ABC transporter permease n=2 Tax=Protaetiibacter larvae TaxID=2592654 RepID=A0A5C1YAH6_9MICO|nr:iron ABC transporter permease [Protaetiibacter larvae]
MVGAQPVPPELIWQALTDADRTSTQQLIVLELRLPRTLLGIAVGVALGAAATTMQALTRNPLAEPGLLGINAGAAAAAATAISLGAHAGPFGHALFAFVGAAAAAIVVGALGGAFRRGTDPVRLVLAGAALSVVLGAYTQVLLINFPEVFDAFRHWVVGSLQGRSWEVVATTAAIVAPAAALALLLTRALNAAALGWDTGRALGVDPRRTAGLGLLVVVVLAGTATAAAGPIGFVGLLAALGVRMLVGPDYRWVMPLAMVWAVVVILGADILARILRSPAELPTSIVTALIGAPVFILIVRRRRLVRL